MKLEWTIEDEDDLEMAVMKLREAIKEAWDNDKQNNPDLTIIID